MPNPQNSTTKRFFEGCGDSDLVFSPDNSIVLICADRQWINTALRPLPASMSHWRQAAWFEADSAPPSIDPKLLIEFLAAIANLPQENCQLGSLGKIIFADLSSELKGEYLSSTTGRAWLGNGDRLLLKLALILHVIESVGSGGIPAKVGDAAIEKAMDLAIAVKQSSFNILGIRF